MALDRREYLRLSIGALGAASKLLGETTPSRLGIPGLYPGKVVGVEHSKCLRGGEYQRDPIAAMLSRGMCELTGESEDAAAWKKFFEPADVVGIKMNPVGQPFVCSSRHMVNAIIQGLQQAGVPLSNIVVYERYRETLEDAGIPKWLPAGVRVSHASPAYSDEQQDIAGYDPEHFVELPYVLPRSNPENPAARRSYAAQFITKQVTKLINLPVLKTHGGAGVTLALKNLSHGLVNNVSRSHDGPTPHYADFIPTVVSLPVIRDKTVLNILDGTRGLYHGGPGIMNDEFVWEHKTIYVATDPVAMDRIGWSVLDGQRKKKRLKPVGEAKPDNLFKARVRQPEHIERAAEMGLGEADPAKIRYTGIKLA